MKKLLLTGILLVFITGFGFTQTNGNDHQKDMKWSKYMTRTEASFTDLQQSFSTYWKDRPYVKGKGYKQFKRWENYMTNRVYPSGDLTLPSSNYHRFLEWKQENVDALGQGKTSWTSVGPTRKPTGDDTGVGRLNMVRFDPTNTDIMYVGAPDGGLWKSTDAGSTWSTMTDFLAVIGVSDLAIDPNNTNIMYLATGDIEGDRRSIGVLKSTDGGVTWNTTGLQWTAQENYRISKLLMDPNNSSILLAATDGGVFKTTDGGATWIEPYDVVNFKDMEFKPGNSNVVYAAGTEFWKSIDKGDTWSQVFDGLPNSDDVARISLAVTEADPETVYVLAGEAGTLGYLGLYLSTDSGESFETQSTSPNILGFETDGSDNGGQANYDLTIAVSPEDADFVTIGGINIWQSDDAGQSWYIISYWDPDPNFEFVHADVHEVSYMPSESKTLLACNDGGISITTDEGNTWTDISNNLAISQQYAIGVSASNGGHLVSGLQDIGSIYTSGSWSVVAGGDGGDCFIDRTNDNNIVVSETNGVHEMSTDGGMTFNEITNGLPTGDGEAEFFSPIIQDPVNASRFYAGGRADLYVSNNMGADWNSTGDQPFDGDHIIRMAVASGKNSVIYAVKEDEIVKSDDQGDTWESITGSLPVGSAAISNLCISSSNENHVWVVFSGYDSNSKVFKSSDGGESWNNLSAGLPNLPANTIVYQDDSDDDIYLGMDIGVFHYNNTTSSWTPFMTDLPNVSIRDLKIFYPDNKIIAATYGRGAWEADLMNPSSSEKDWTMIVYLVGSNLESDGNAGTTDIQEMIDAGSTKNVNVVVLTGGANKPGWKDMRSWLIKDGVQTELSFSPTTTEMSDPNSVTEFINFATKNYPAEKTALVFWNHGGDIRGYGNDEITGKSLSVPQISSAIANSEFIDGGKNFELIGFDACLMANLETQSSLKDFGNWFVGSEEQEPGHGWDYTPIVQAMESGDAAGGDELGAYIVDGFQRQSIDQNTTAITLAVSDLSKISIIEDRLFALLNLVKEDGQISKLHKARSASEEYSKSIKTPEYSEDMVDLRDWLIKFDDIISDYTAEVDLVLEAIDEAVYYHYSDDARPHANGISIYVPHNVLVDEGELDWVLENYYHNIDFSSNVKSFIVDDYIPTALDDNDPPSGNIDHDFTFFTKDEPESGGAGLDSISAIKIQHQDDLEQVQVVLVEEFAGMPNEFILLGSTFPDTIVVNPDQTEIYAYKWDEMWLGINGHPAYISDIHHFEVEESPGVIKKYTRIHIPALHNPGTADEQHVLMSFRFDDNFNHTLENIIPEVQKNGQHVLLPKERVFLQPGDELQFIYEVFNEQTDEQYFLEDPNAILTIVNGNEDLNLEHDRLEEGNYHIGYVLEDHSQNDTIIFDTRTFMVMGPSSTNSFDNHYFKVYPNPTSGSFTIDQANYDGGEVIVRLYNSSGQIVLQKAIQQKQITMNPNIPSGVYQLEIIKGENSYSDQLIFR